MRIIIHPHARTHGLANKQIIEAYETGSNGAIIRYRDRTAEPPRWATIGFDSDGHEIELVFVKLEGNAILIIHANRLTKGFLQEIRNAR